MSDGSQQGIGPERALKTILGGKPPPAEQEEKSPAWWSARLDAKDDNIDGYDEHAEVMAKYIARAIRNVPGLDALPNSDVYLDREDGTTDYQTVLVPSLDKALKLIYHDEAHPFRRAFSQATGFSWGWAYNIARYSLGLPPRTNPAIVTIGERS